MDVQEAYPPMAFSRAIAAAKTRGPEQTINEHLVKLMAFEARPELRSSWKRELVRKHFEFLRKMRLKPDRRRVPARDFREWLYTEPFEGNEVGYTEALIGLSVDTYARNDVPVEALADMLKAFHEALAPRLSRGDDAADLVEAL